ncbi:MAG: purple acid phosphatase family protein [Bryobacteraceae bacterium]
MRSLLLVAAACSFAAENSNIRTYVADLDSNSVTLAWGTTDGTNRNSIGRGAEGSGKAEVGIDGRTISSNGSWVRIDGLKPDTTYPYSVRINGAEAAASSVRTWPEKSDTLIFFVIGDFGTGVRIQHRLGARMEEERLRLEKSNRPVRFVLSTGDNIYGKLAASGAQDRDWERKFFAPYSQTLRAIPFKAVLGNHDGNESERTADLAVCLDNFFMPGRWYRFEYASLVEFIALDSTTNQPSGPPSPVYLAKGEQSNWLGATLAKPALPWRLAVLHHPMFTAGPNHPPFLPKAQHWFRAMRSSGVQAVFSGHEHNLQISERNEETGHMQFVVSGAGGELRSSSVRRKMGRSHISAWSNQSHFLVVTITGKQMTIEPIGVEPINLRYSSGKPATNPVRVVSNR